MKDHSTTADSAFDAAVDERVRLQQTALYRRTDRMFAYLMVAQWVGGIIAALVVSPRTWLGAESRPHPHVCFAIIVGGVLCSLPVWLAWKHPGRLLTRMVIGSSQLLFSCLLIHLTGGRIETHFHVFGSLAFLAFYRDWRVLVPATVIVAPITWCAASGGLKAFSAYPRPVPGGGWSMPVGCYLKTPS
jgi:hypothetical protein